jgi:uncharacterized protein (DUF4415 family)
MTNRACLSEIAQYMYTVHMQRKYDFSRGKRGAVLPTKGKTRITIYLDDEIVQRFKAESERTGKGYQTLINDALAVSKPEPPITASQVRKIVREELAGTGATAPPRASPVGKGCCCWIASCIATPR